MTKALFFQTAIERYNMLLAIKNGSPKNNCTDDPIFQQYRFCNVFREDDKVTTWFRENVRKPLADNHLQQLKAAVCFRWFNNIVTGERTLPFLLGEQSTSWAWSVVKGMAQRGERILNPAYMIKSPPGMDKATGLFNCIEHVYNDAEMLTSEILQGQRLYKAHDLLKKYPYLGPFMAYQIVCDLRFTPLLQEARDINVWTAPGPGSARGIGRIFHSDPSAYNYNSEKDQMELRSKMIELLACSREGCWWPAMYPAWELSTVQHWCCEYDKYMRAARGEGTPKQKYKPS